MEKVKKIMAGSLVKDCTCYHEFQNKTYGQRKRVHTIGGTIESPKYTCTVCGRLT